MRAISTLSFDAGTSTFWCRARIELRMRVSMSATGSVNLILVSPHVARLLQPKYAAEEPAATSYAPCGILPQGRSCARRREILTRTTSKHLESRHATRGYGSTGAVSYTHL